MKQKLFTLLTLLVLCVTGAWASTETVSWTDMAIGSANANKAGAATSAQLTPASGVISSGISANGTKEISSVTYYRYNGFAVAEDVSKYFEYSFTVASGYVFSPSKISVGWAPNGGKAISFAVYAGTSSSDLVKIATLTHSGDNVFAVDDITDFSALGLKTNFTLVRLVPYGKASSIILNSVAIQGSLVADSRSDVTLSFASSSGSMDIATASPALPAVTSAPNVTDITGNLSYSTSNSAVATFNALTGALTLVGIGTTTITASFGGDSNYKPASDTYTLTVTDATKLGYAEVLNPDDKTLANRWLFGMSHASVTQTFADYYSDGAIVDDGATTATLFLNGEAAANQYTNTKSWRKTQNGFIVDGKEQWVGYNIEIDENYLLNLTHLDARILIADNTYTWYVEILDKNGIQVYKSANQTTTKASTANLSTDINLTNLTGTVSVKLWVTQGGSHKRFSIEKLILTGTTAEDTRAAYTITYDKGEGAGIVPDAASVREGDGYKTIKPYFLTKSGETFTGWKNAEDIYAAGDVFVPTGNMTLTAQFEPNAASLSASTAETTVLWDFQKKNIGSFNLASGTLVTQATVGGKTIDLPLSFDKQVRNDNWQDWATFNSAVTMTIPAIKGMQITMLTYESPSTMTIAGATDYTVTGSSNPYTVTYTYTGTDETIDICPIDASYIRTIQVVYPKTLAANPTITKGDFSFSTKSYSVTVTAEDGDALYVSTDGSSYSEQTSPYETTIAAGATCYAKASADGGTTYSDVVTCTNELDGAKSYIAWVYTSDYSTGSGKPNYAFATDPMVIALQTDYNVVPVDYAQGDTPSADLKNADLIVCSEAMSGDKTMSNGMVDLLDGTAPMIGLKMYNYGAGSDATKRWKWGLPNNPTSTVYGFTAKNAHYKVLDGVTFESDGTIKLATDRYNDSNYKNVIQTANFTGVSKPTDNVILGTLGSDDTKAVMHYSATKKYFGLGLSCDCWEYYTANATTIVKNAAAMLIAGEDLTAANAVAQVTGKITAAGWTTFSSSEKLDLSTISGGTAYYASGVNGTNAVLTPTGDVVVAAGTGLMIKGTPGDDFTIDVTGASVTFTEENLLEGLPNGGTVEAAGSGFNYVFGWASAHPEAPGFYKVNGTSAVLGSGKAYLHTTAELADPGALLGLIFDEESDVTSIKNLTPALSQSEGAVFDLQGRQVAQPAKGLYIVNGKKVVLK